MTLMVAVYRAPMRSRNDDAVELQATIDRALRLGLCGFGQLVSRPGEQERLERRVARFAELDEGSFVWTRDTDGSFWLGRICGPYSYDPDKTSAALDLVHVRPCAWLPMPMLEQDVPSAVVATFRRGGRNFQEIHHPSIDEETERIWDRDCGDRSTLDREQRPLARHTLEGVVAASSKAKARPGD